jgi:hypothetical protein
MLNLEIEMNEKIKIEITSKVLINQDLCSAALWHKEQIELAVANDDHEALTFKIMSCLVMCAFTHEANLNFIGYHLFEDWGDKHERKNAEKKLRKIAAHLGLNINMDVVPFKTLDTLKLFRDCLAHGKPEEITVSEEKIANMSSIDTQFQYPKAEWEKYCTAENAMQAYEDVDVIWKMLLGAANIELWDTLSHGERSITIVR